MEEVRKRLTTLETILEELGVGTCLLAGVILGCKSVGDFSERESQERSFQCTRVYIVPS